jgi:hypothetical protein
MDFLKTVGGEMAQFRGTVEGRSKTEASRLGSVESGLQVEANGWHFGVRVILESDDTDGDTATILLTSGSSAKGLQKLLGVYTRRDLNGD